MSRAFVRPRAPHPRRFSLSVVALAAATATACGDEGAPETERMVVDFRDAATGGTDAPTGGSRPDALRPGPVGGSPGGGGSAGGPAPGGFGGETPPAGGDVPPPDTGADAGAGGVEPEPEPDVVPDPPAEICRRMRVVNTGADGLNVRPDASTNGAPVGHFTEGTEADVLAEVMGQDIEGNPVWFEVQREGVHGFVTSVFAECLRRGVPPMSPPAPGPRDDVFLLPFRCGESARVSQGNGTDRSHNGAATWAFDFDLPLGRPMVAMKPGEVLFVRGDTGPGDPCYDGGGQACAGEENFVVVGHADGTRTRYLHLSRISVAPGQLVAQGEVVGAVGSTGWTSGPHAHVVRTEACGAPACNSVPLSFADVPGEGVPAEGDTVTSENGCAP